MPTKTVLVPLIFFIIIIISTGDVKRTSGVESQRVRVSTKVPEPYSSDRYLYKIKTF